MWQYKHDTIKLNNSDQKTTANGETFIPWKNWFWERFEPDCIPQSDTVSTSSYKSSQCDLLLSQLSQPNACTLFLLIGFCDFIPHPYGTRISFCLNNINPLCFSTAMYTMLMKRFKQMMDCSLTAKATSLSLPLKREIGRERERQRESMCYEMQSVAAAKGVKHKLVWF